MTHLTHHNWQISADYGCPDPASTWTATSPDFDVDFAADGQIITHGSHVRAATYEDLLLEIEAAIEEEV